ncbi:MAG: EVE domain-containing protein [Chloroflexota bacterium]
MPGSHWMIVTTPENHEISRERGYTLLGLKARHRKKAERMLPGDRILIFISHERVFACTATVTSGFFEDHRVIWQNNERRNDVFPWRIPLQPDFMLDEAEHLDAYQIAPRLQYVKRWAPEDWPLAFQGQVHLLSSSDFSIVEHEMRRLGAGPRQRARPQPPSESGEPPARVAEAVAGANHSG